MIRYPEALPLALQPTPLETLSRLSERWQVEVLCKRDDLTGSTLSGNKVRKLEFLFADAVAQQAQGVITCGGAQSNHSRATAVAAAQLGLRCKLLLRTKDPKTPPPLTGNLLLDRLTGASVRWITPEQYAARQELLAEEADIRKTEDGSVWYVIPEGGSNALGAWGYVRCAEELAAQLGARPATIIYAVGSGGTAAGLIAGCSLLNLPYRLIGVCVCDSAAHFQHRIAEILTEMAARYDVDVAKSPDEIEIWEDYIGEGYAISRDEELASMRDFARIEGIVTDPVYSGKAFYGLQCELARGRQLPQPIVFLHTGGIFGLFPKANQLDPLLT